MIVLTILGWLVLAVVAVLCAVMGGVFIWFEWMWNQDHKVSVGGLALAVVGCGLIWLTVHMSPFTFALRI